MGITSPEPLLCIEAFLTGKILPSMFFNDLIISIVTV